MKKSDELRAKALQCKQDAETLAAKAETDEDVNKVAQLKADHDKYLAQAETIESVEQMAANRTSNPPVIANPRERFEDDPKRGFATPRDFMLSVITAGQGGRVNENLRSLSAGSDEAGEYDDSKGGFLIPPAFISTLLQTTVEADPIAARVQALPMSTPVVKIPARVDKNHSTQVGGGLNVYRRAETQTVTPSRATFELITLSADTLMGLAYATEELLTDSPISFAAIIQSGFAEAFRVKLISERISGNGVGQFLGILNSDCLVSVAAEDGQSANTINGTNIVKMRAQAYNYGNSIWMANHDTYTQLCQAHIAGTNNDIFLFNPARGEDVPDMLLGRPIIFTEYAKTLGDLGDIILADWSQYLEGTLEPMKNASSIHVRFVNHEQTLKLWMRNAGAPWWTSTLTPVNSSTTLSPFVALAAR